jgi:citrate lyase subunit beta/citryl-CoA lyase
MRSLLFVPGDRPERMEKALAAGADAVVLDLEDSVAPEKKADARKMVADFLARPRRLPLFVRINPLARQGGEDLQAVLSQQPDAIVLPKAEGGQSVRELDASLTALGNATTRILPIASETPRAVFALGSYAGAPRLMALTWGAEDLTAAVGAITAREENGRFTPPYEMVRACALFGACAAGIAAIETIYPDFRDEAGLAAFAARARRDGFTGMLAIHPAQVSIITAAFRPAPEELAHARRIVVAFAEAGNAGVVQLDGRMLDAPHLARAQQLLAGAAKRD